MSNNVNFEDMQYKTLTNAEEVLNLIDKDFDDIFRENNYDNIETINEALTEDYKFIYFSYNELPCALALTKEDPSEGIEINLVEVIDKWKGFSRGIGIGSAVIKILKEKIYPDEYIFGYSVPEASVFWSKVSNNYDKEIFDEIQDSFDKEEECYMSESLMHFEL